MFRFTASAAIMLQIIYYFSCMIDARPTVGFNSTSEYSDNIAEEQRLAVQIITTDGPSESSSSTQKHGSQSKSSSDINGAISFDDQYELMQTKLEPEDRAKTKLHPKRIVINLGSLFANKSSGSSLDSQSSSGTKMIIGFSPDSHQASTTSRPSLSNQQQSKPVGRLAKSSSIRSAQNSGGGDSRAAKSMRSVIMDAIREQGGVPTVVIEDKHVTAGSQSREPRFRFMVDAEDDPAPAPTRAQSSHNFETTRGSLSMAAAENEASLRNEVDGLSNEVEPPSTALSQTGRLDDNQVSASESQSAGEQANQADEESASVLRPPPRKFYYDDRLDASDSLRSGDTFDFGSGSSDEQGAELDDGGQESAESEQTQDVQAADEQAGKKSAVIEVPRAKPVDAKKKPSSVVEKPLLVAYNSNAIREQQAQQNLHQDAEQAEPVQAAPEQAASTAAKKRQPQAKQQPAQAKEEQQQRKQPPPAKQQVAQRAPKPQRPGAPPVRAKSSPEGMDERVARILDQLKLYTTKDQLMKVARDLDAYPSREDVESSDEDEPSRKSTNSRQLTLRLSSPERAQSESSQGRNKVPAPLLYSVREPTRSEEVDSAGSEMVPADSQLDASEDRDSDGKGGIELLDKFLARQQRLRSMAQLEDEQQAGQTGEAKRDADDPSTQEPDSDSDSAQEDSSASEPSASSRTEDDSVRDYTSNRDLVDMMQSNERAYESDESQTLNSYAEDPRASTQVDSSSYNKDPDSKGADEVRAVEQSLDELAAQEKQIEQAQS